MHEMCMVILRSHYDPWPWVVVGPAYDLLRVSCLLSIQEIFKIRDLKHHKPLQRLVIKKNFYLYDSPNSAIG